MASQSSFRKKNQADSKFAPLLGVFSPWLLLVLWNRSLGPSRDGADITVLSTKILVKRHNVGIMEPPPQYIGSVPSCGTRSRLPYRACRHAPDTRQTCGTHTLRTSHSLRGRQNLCSSLTDYLSYFNLFATFRSKASFWESIVKTWLGRKFLG